MRLPTTVAGFTWAVVALWVPSVIVVCAYLLGGHLLTLPKPAQADPRLARALAALRAGEGRPRWIALHVLYEGCRCSRRVFDHLVARGASPAMAERVLLVGGSEASVARARAAGYAAEALTRDGLRARYGFEAAPVMVVADPRGRVRYLGGYTARKQGAAMRDVDIVRRAQAGEAVAALPLFGCAVSARLQRDTDPLGLRR